MILTFKDSEEYLVNVDLITKIRLIQVGLSVLGRWL